MPRLDVGHRRIIQGREGKVLRTWQTNSQSKEREDGERGRRTPCSHSSPRSSVIRRRRAFNAFTPVAEAHLGHHAQELLVQTPFLYLRIPQ